MEKWATGKRKFMDLMQSRLSLLWFETTATPMSYSNTSSELALCKWSHKINFDQWFEQTTRNKSPSRGLARISLATKYLHSIHIRLAGLCEVMTRAIANVRLCCAVCLIKIFSSVRWLLCDVFECWMRSACDDLSANKPARRPENGGNAFSLREAIYFGIFQLIFHLFFSFLFRLVCVPARLTFCSMPRTMFRVVGLAPFVEWFSSKHRTENWKAISRVE